MKKFVFPRRFSLLAVIMLTVNVVFAADGGEYDVSFVSLLEEMVDVAAHSKWSVPSYTCSQSSSYSRQSVTPETAAEDGRFRPERGRDWGKGWFENHDFNNYIREEEVDGATEYVMFDQKGPGVIVRFWMAYADYIFNGGANIRIYIDGNEKPVIDENAASLVGSNALVGYPFSYMAPAKSENPLWHGNNLILPIPYAYGCKISFRPHEPRSPQNHFNYYQINYRSYEPGTRVESFNSGTMKKYAKQIYACGAELTGERSVVKDACVRGKNGVLAPGKVSVIGVKGEKCITSLSLQISAQDQSYALDSTFVKIRFDGDQTVCCPAGQFFGIGPRQLVNNTFYVKTHSNGVMTAYWTMPFQCRAEVSIENTGTRPVNVDYFGVSSRPSKWDAERSMYFHASWTKSLKVDGAVKFDYNYVSIKGKGKYVADNLTVYNYFPDSTGINWWGEGDEKVFVDGEKFPSHFGTGSEDYYSYAWCRPQPFSYPAISQPIGDGNKTPGLTVDNRYRLLDDIPFTTELRFYMEIWHPWYGTMDYSPATFWYAFKGCQWTHETK